MCISIGIQSININNNIIRWKVSQRWQSQSCYCCLSKQSMLFHVLHECMYFIYVLNYCLILTVKFMCCLGSSQYGIVFISTTLSEISEDVKLVNDCDCDCIVVVADEISTFYYGMISLFMFVISVQLTIISCINLLYHFIKSMVAISLFFYS